MQPGRLLEIADELEVDTDGAWAEAGCESSGVELVSNPMGLRRLAAILLRAAASDDVIYTEGLEDLFGKRVSIFAIWRVWDPRPNEPPPRGAPWVDWVVIAAFFGLLAGTVILAFIGLVSLVS